MSLYQDETEDSTKCLRIWYRCVRAQVSNVTPLQILDVGERKLYNLLTTLSQGIQNTDPETS